MWHVTYVRHEGKRSTCAVCPSAVFLAEEGGHGGAIIFLGFLGPRDVAGSDDVGLALDHHLNDCSMVCVRSEQDDEIVSGHGSFQSFSIVHVE